MRIQVLGPGCANCRLLADKAVRAVHELELDAEIEKVTDLNAISDMGVFRTPALVVDGEVKLSGRVPSVADLKKLLSGAG